MLGETRSAQRGRWIALLSLPPCAVALMLWLAGLLTLHTVVPAALLTLAGMAAMGTVLASSPARLLSGVDEASWDCPPAPERTRVLIVGAGASACRAAVELESGGDHVIVGFVSDGPPATGSSARVLGSTEEIPALVRRLDVQQVIVVEPPAWQQQLAEMVGASARSPVGVHVVPGLYEARVGRLQFHRVRDLPLVDLAPAAPSAPYEVTKRALDFVLSAVGLVLTAPAVALAALAVKLTSPGPAFFRQERVGKGGGTFTIYKLRTMVMNAEQNTGPVLSAGRTDSRITPVGNFLRATRLDELPQLVNVLRGEMSLVGPRPERPCFVSRYEDEIPGYRERHQVTPGITGLAQVNGGYTIAAELKLRYDLLYIYNRSLWSDMRIMAQTVGTVFRRTGQ